MGKIKVAVVGLGHRGRHMALLAQRFAPVEVVAACDVDAALWCALPRLFRHHWSQRAWNALIWHPYVAGNQRQRHHGQ